jgi:hypothetical protein
LKEDFIHEAQDSHAGTIVRSGFPGSARFQRAHSRFAEHARCVLSQEAPHFPRSRTGGQKRKEFGKTRGSIGVVAWLSSWIGLFFIAVFRG